MKNPVLCYSVGPLLYCPASSKTIAGSILREKFGKNFSLALCLEDTISDGYVEEAEEILIRTLKELYSAGQSHSFFMPKLFIRIRNASQMPGLLKRLDNARVLLRGFILPKFDLENADTYIETAVKINEDYPETRYIMPIMESSAIIDLRYRAAILYELKEKLDKIDDIVLNIRTGGNDLCHAFGIRRHEDETIHSILPVSGILSDIITVFGRNYVISGPVWEYYNGNGWAAGLRQELRLDRLAGFIGKTVIHPRQISLVNEAYMVAKEDFEDAKAILNWRDSSSLVSGSAEKNRMNEHKTHSNWAAKILCLAEAYGIR